MNILLIDDDDVILEYLQSCLEGSLPQVKATKYSTLREGRPGSDFDWAAYDLLVLDYNLGGGETGIDWLEAFGGKPGFPRTLLLTAEDSAQVVGHAVRVGAGGYLNKAGLTPQLLVDTVRGMIEFMPPEEREERGSAKSGAKYKGRDTLETGPGRASYRFTRLIGRGGMARVYLAERTDDGITVVLKILDRDIARDPDNAKRFDREGEMLSRIESPYVVKVYDHGHTNSYGYIAMEFFGRGDLQQRMAQGVSPEDAVLYLHNIACGLEAIHGVGIVHRDLKAGNVMFRGDGSMALVDFGLSKRVDTDMTLTETGAIMGTPYCMSPEQTAGRKLDARSDLYSAGVLFYEMLTGSRPYTGKNLPQLLLQIQTAPIPQLPPPLGRFQVVVGRLLAKDPEDRYQSAGALIEALEPLLPPG